MVDQPNDHIDRTLPENLNFANEQYRDEDGNEAGQPGNKTGNYI